MDWLIFGSINIIIMVLMFLFLSRRIHRQYNSSSFLQEIQQEVNAIVTELNQTTERNVQIIEERIQAVQELMVRFDRRIKLANAEETQREESQKTYGRIREQRMSTQREIYRDQQRVPESVPNEAVVPAISDPSPPLAPISEPLKPTMDHPRVTEGPLEGLRQNLSRDARKNQVVEMSKAGISASLISQRMGMSMGEVELIISLQG